MKFEAITPMPSTEEQQRASTLRRGRLDRQARAAETRRARLLDVAWGMLKEVGLARFNMRELGLRAGYSAGAMYAYFASRDHILLALRERWVEEVTLRVAQVRPARRARRSASLPGSAPSPGPQGQPADAAAEARERFLARSEAWWDCVSREAFVLPLLMMPGPWPDVRTSKAGLVEQAAGQPPVALTPLASLALATHPCVEDLEAAGWGPEPARRLQSEALCLGVGLAVLGASPGQGGEKASASQKAEGFRQTLEHWLLQGDPVALSQVHAPGGGQSDLFVD